MRELAAFIRSLQRALLAGVRQPGPGTSIAEEMHTKTKLPGITRAPTARDAFAAVEPAARRYDPEARLTLITTDERIQPSGRSHYWFFGFDLPSQQAQGYFEVRVSEDVDPDDEPADYYLVEVAWPFPRPGTTMAQMLAQGTMSRGFVRQQWQRELDRNRPLPVPFRDSPEAVQSLREQSNDAILNTSHWNLDTAFLPTGEAVWRSSAFDVEYHTPFAASE